ncbi:alpha-ketoglutarate-dependent dioxygenase AlkB family protein [Aestuariivivens sediminicola]|uniref:alpha-ketoglutarate-dependent dioxygenase AlkB family protein n=1 Tax=Aestuariivivens sediminicola TaxID=2913560 RepID=UPI001F560019|nr:alpha-ketoglutarate-dependent dioxygenase AlkB [Aestuariivivens sediminicola]
MFQEELITHNFDLPDADIILFDNVFGITESEKLYSRLYQTISWQQDIIRFFGKVYNVPRLTALYGDADKTYTYSGISMYPKPWTKELLIIKNRIEEITGVTFTTCLLNLYRTGSDSNDWHQDNEKELGLNPIIASVSFGGLRLFKLKHINNSQLKTVDIPLRSGSLLLMKRTTQHFWKHKIPKTTKKVNPRINLTFRVIKAT